ncbi:DUF1353 domain-containing protein [Agromyces sp. SYSU K20354]|uniref:DUF1353 domain-containing protein n=1 Tax=Agromyces cavernae TaxID=2898659 RepID=UPI001E4B0E03|nr:DUF1353 domain-containing protein [Agromyces cavernae]MCD2441512.1 DUF1353 domain-containing protein [Agromyces cavernae]
MPFLTDDGHPLDELALAQRPADGYRFELREPFVYVDPASGRRYPVPEQSGQRVETDLASVPTLVWAFIASYGRQSAPAVMHDVYAAPTDEPVTPDRRAELERRREVDRVFRTALREQGVPLLRSTLMWAWVSADRERGLAGVAGAVFVWQAILGAIVVVAASVLAFWNIGWLVLAVLPAIAAVPWWRLAPLMLLLNYSGAVLSPLVVLQLLAVAPFRLIEVIVELVTGGDPGSVVRPTAVGRSGRRR